MSGDSGEVVMEEEQFDALSKLKQVHVHVCDHAYRYKHVATCIRTCTCCSSCFVLLQMQNILNEKLHPFKLCHHLYSFALPSALIPSQSTLLVSAEDHLP